jgi:hypothetical protein
MSGWRRIGIVLSVFWFLGFGIFLWHQLVEDAVRPYTAALQRCSLIEDNEMNGLQYITDPDKRDKRLYAILDNEHRCKEDAALQWKSTQPSDGLLAVVMLATNLVTIALGWLIVWGCVAVVRWIRRGLVSHDGTVRP